MANGPNGSLHFFIFTTDRGSNEVLAKKMWLTLSRDSKEIVILNGDCLEHAGHLVALQSQIG